MYDLIVAGGGPAGTAAAITATRAGATVLLLERGKFPRHKVCGEFVSAESLELLSRLLESRQLLESAISIHTARLFLDGRVLETPVEPPAASIARFDLDAALWSAAVNAGVDARDQVSVQNIGGDGPFLVATTAGEFESRAVVNASGRWSNLNPQSQTPDKWLGLKGHFAEAEPPISVDLYFFDGGYCGVQPVTMARVANGGRVNVCAAVRADCASTLKEVFERHPELEKRSRRWQVLTPPVSTSPLVFRTPNPAHNGTIMVGDSAGFVDPFVGDGISLALRSGALSAECLGRFFREGDSLEDALANYARGYHEELGHVHRASAKIRRMLALPKSLRAPVLYLFEKAPGLAEYLVRGTR